LKTTRNGEDDDDSIFDILEVWDKEEEEEERMHGDLEADRIVQENDSEGKEEEDQNAEDTSTESLDEDKWTAWNVNEWVSTDGNEGTDRNKYDKEQKVSQNMPPASR